MHTRRSPQLPKPARRDQILEKKHSWLHSILRKVLHKRLFNKMPKTIRNLSLPKALLRPENQKLLHAFFRVCASDAQVFPEQIDHWTTHKNLRSIIRTGGLLGHDALNRNQIRFDPNVFDNNDRKHGDSNVICLAPSYVDPDTVIYLDYLTPKDDLVLLRINTRQIQKSGQYNCFFKITDLCGQSFVKTIHVSSDLSIEISKNIEQNYISPIKITFTFKPESNDPENSKVIIESIIIPTNACLFYGKPDDIRHFCLQLLFYTLKFSKNPLFVTTLYAYLNTLSEETLESLLLTFAKSITLVSELNINGFLPLTPHLIQNVHFVNENKTISIDQQDEDRYTASLNALRGHKKRILEKGETEMVVQEGAALNSDCDFLIYNTPTSYLPDKTRVFTIANYAFPETDLRTGVELDPCPKRKI